MQHVSSYIEYCNIVGDNGGIMMSEKQFEEYKLKHQELSANRIHTVWKNEDGSECKNIGLTSKCFCDHPYKNHDYVAKGTLKVKCKAAGCKCADFTYIPIYGSQDFKCTCKHSYQNHNLTKNNCSKCPCKGFTSNWTCSCKQPYSYHQTVSFRDDKKEINSLHPTQGKITSYSAMLDQADRHEEDIKKEVKNRKLKVVIEQFQIRKPILEEEKSAWELSQTPISWIK